LYHHVHGDLFQLNPTSAVVVAGGVGFDLRIPLSTYEKLKGGKEAFLFTHFHVREDDFRLFGFATTGERDLFRLLLSVTGVGPSIALASLCALSPEELARAISRGELKVIQTIKGVGRKLAERMVLELRERAGRLLISFAGTGAEGGSPPQGEKGEEGILLTPEAADAVSALITLGFERKKAEEKVEATLRALQKSGPSPGHHPVEQIIKESLRRA
jgi:Holliday junction DNA helicase RuvA